MPASIGLQTQIWNNNLKSTLLLASYPILLLLLIGAYAAPTALWLAGNSVWLLLIWLSLPLALGQLRQVYGPAGRPLNAALKGTARLQLVFGVLLALGLIL